MVPDRPSSTPPRIPREESDGPRTTGGRIARVSAMKIRLRDEYRRPVGRLEVDRDRRPVRAIVPETEREVFLQWDSAIDDAGHLRRCVACGCPDLFHEKAFPVITSVIVVLAFVGAAVGLLGFADRPVVLAVLLAVLVADVAVFTLSKRHLVCYACHSSYPGEPIARYHRGWDRAVAERHPRRTPPVAPASAGARDADPSRGSGGDGDGEQQGGRADPRRGRPAPRPAIETVATRAGLEPAGTGGGGRGLPR